jgi:hypothetical protein
MGPRNRFQGMNFASLCSLAGRYDNPIPPRFLAPIDSLKIPAQKRLLFKRYSISQLIRGYFIKRRRNRNFAPQCFLHASDPLIPHNLILSLGVLVVEDWCPRSTEANIFNKGNQCIYSSDRSRLNLILKSAFLYQ